MQNLLVKIIFSEKYNYMYVYIASIYYIVHVLILCKWSAQCVGEINILDIIYS